MQKTYTQSELQEIMDLYQQDATRDEAKNRAEQLMRDFVAGQADFDINDANTMHLFEEIINTFGSYVDPADGQTKLTELGAQARALIEQIVSNANNAVNASSQDRIYQLTSDQNQIKFDLVTLKIYQQMGLVDSSLDPANMTPGAVADAIGSVNLSQKQRTEYSARFVNTILADPELFELTPPKILADAYTFTKEQLNANPTDANLVQQFRILSGRIDYLVDTFWKKVDYFYADPSNIADIWAGYRKMCDVRRPDIKVANTDAQDVKQYKQNLNKAMDETIAQLQTIVDTYEDMWNLKKLKPENAAELDSRWKNISQLLQNVELSDQVLSVLSNWKFLDENGNPMPQFIDDQGNDSLTFKPGYKLKPDGRLNRVISLAKSDVTMRNVGDLNIKEQDIDLLAALEERMPWKMAEISIPDQVMSGIEQNPHKMLNQQEVDTLWNEVKTNGGDITDAGYQAALDAQVNQAAGFAGMMAEKVGNDKPIVMRPFEAVEDIDKLAKTRSEKIGAYGRGKKMGLFKRMAKNFGMAAVFSAGLTFIGKATGVAYAGAAIGTAIGVGNMVYQGFKWRREQKKAGKPYGLKAFFSDKRNWGPAAASGLGVAAVISMATGNPELAAGFGIGAMTAGGTSAAVMTYKDALNSGWTKGQAIAGAIGVAGSIIAGGLVGRAAMNGVINYVNNNTDSHLFKTEHTTTTTHTTTQNHYPDGWIEHHKEMMLNNHWETPQTYETRINGLMDAGLNHDDAVRYLVAWHDATDHYLGGGYFNGIGMDANAVHALGSSINGTTINLTPESMAAFNHFNPHFSGINTVGYTPNAPINTILPPNATYDANGVLIPGHDFYSTYVNFGQGVQQVPVMTTEISSVFTPNELAFPAGIGTMGIYEPRVVPQGQLEVLTERASALLDRDNAGNQNTQGGNGITPPSTTNGGTTPSSTTNGGTTPPSTTNGGITPPSTTNGGTTPPSTTNGGTTPSSTTNGGTTPPSTTNGGTTPPSTTNGGTTPPSTTNGGTIPQTKRGFFGKMKDIIYKTGQAVYHGLQKTQQGVHQMKKQQIINQNERAIERAKGIKALNEEYGDMSIEQINEINLKDAAAIAGQSERFKKRLGQKSLRLSAKLARAKASKDFERQQTLENELFKIKVMDAKLESIKKMGGQEALQTLKEAMKLENEIDKIEEQGKVDLEVMHAKGRNKVKDIKAEGRTTRIRKAAQGLSAMFKGLFDKTNDDIKYKKNAVKYAEEKLKQAKTDR